MTKEPVICVTQLSKCYNIYSQPRDRLLQGLQKLWLGKKQYARKFWALSKVSFDVHRGECLGILGRNGAGKSTLLQLIAKTLEPTSGSVEVKGKVAALLELGSGFNLEFTCRENVYLNSSILGLTDNEINQRFSEIAAFADIGDFIEQPVKTYSSGMMMRLAFAVQTAVQPDVLIVDEALAVGDVRFQKKCYDRMYRLKEEGGTILLVTHDSGTIVQMCDRAIIVENGQLHDEGDPQRIARCYHKLLFGGSEQTLPYGNAPDKTSSMDSHYQSTTSEPDISLVKTEASSHEVRYGSKDAEIIDVYLVEAAHGTKTRLVDVGNAYSIRFTVRYNRNVINNIAFGFLISNSKGIEIYATNSSLHDIYLEPALIGTMFECSMSFSANLVPGDYFLTVAIAPSDADETDNNNFYDLRFDTLQFQVIGSVRCHTTSLIDLNSDIHCNQF